MLTEEEVSWSIPTGLKLISFILETRSIEGSRKKKQNARAFLITDYCGEERLRKQTQNLILAYKNSALKS